MLYHPRGLLNRSTLSAGRRTAALPDVDSATVVDGYITAGSESEAAAVEAREDLEFDRWVDRIYSVYKREEMNHFEHNVQVCVCVPCVSTSSNMCPVGPSLSSSYPSRIS